MRFVNTNVLLYAVSTSADEHDKAETARGLLEGTDLCLSTQVLAEFYVQATRATRPDRLRHDQAERLVRSFARFPVQPLTAPLVLSAVAACERYRISYWDAAIVEAGRALGAATVLSEDLQDGMDFGGVSISDPFRVERSQHQQ